MVTIVTVLIVVILLVTVLLLFLTLQGRQETGNGKAKKKKRSKGRDALIRDATRRLAQNPKDPEALQTLGELYYQDQVWDKAYKTYETLVELCATNAELNEFEINLRYAMSALKLNLLEPAYKGFVIARSLNQNNFEVNYNLGILEFQKKAYEKSVQLLQQARTQDPEHAQTLRYLGLGCFKLHRYKEALVYLRKAIDLVPDDKESLYAMGECYYELGQAEQAIKIFTHLRPDPVLGPSACLFAGTIHLNQHQFQKAIMDFEIGLKHQDAKPEVMVEIKYRLAMAYLRQQDIGRALALLNDIQSTYPNYKDVPNLIGKYQELNSNKNLQIYLMASTGDFVTLCRKIVLSFFPNAKVKITNIAVNKNEWVDILTEVDTPKWADVVMFRFIRSTGSVGELIVRDFHAQLKDVKAGKGLCITAGTFTDEAKKFVEARLIDLYDKEKLGSLLKGVDATTTALNL
ncbi:MAG: tetratricopeptide repeat protein [Termitinemataceae bacterium]